MMKKLIYLLSCFMLISLTIQAQHNHNERCGSDHIRSEALANNPNAAQRIESIERFTQQWIANNPNAATSRSVITIPIIFHVVWNDPAENVSMAQIQSQIDVLNTDFRKLNADTSFIPSVFQSLASDTEIQFCLAQTNPSGGPTDGVNRIQTTVNEVGNYSDSILWQTIAPLWDTSSYLNIYVCEIGGGTLGYATFPGSPKSGLDGVVLDYKYLGTTGTAPASAPYNLGRTLTHEVGHYLNLSHIWGHGASGCFNDDFVSDTPLQEYPNYGCNTHPLVSCGSPDMFMNYMDYGEDACLVMFSQGQKLRMLAALNGPRANLLNSTACNPFIPVVRYVNHAATGANNGTSWANAFTDLSDALNIAQTYDAIWVAQGAYTPGGANPTRFSYFNMPDSVAVYGGFNGTETEVSQRDYVANETILSGDLNGDDISGDLTTNRSENTYHVMFINEDIDNLAIIDGFTFTSGNANGSIFSPEEKGGGIYTEGAPSILNCTFKENYGARGGGIYRRAESLFFGIMPTSIIVDNCSFLDNVAERSSGAISSFGSGTYSNCYFSGNSAGNSAGYGGALYLGGGEFDVTDCVFENNTASEGGAIGTSNFLTDYINIINCDFTENHATDTSGFGNGGGAISNSTSLVVQTSIFNGNTANERGGAISNHDGGNMTIVNSLIIKNTATGLGLGGAIFNLSRFDDATLTLTNSTIANNYGANTGGIYQFDDNEYDDDYEYIPMIELSNTILSNYNNNYGADSTTALVVSHQGNISSDSALAHVFTHVIDLNNTNPLFRDTTNNDFRLNNGTPAHDLGLMANAPLLDLDGFSRVGHPDAGAYEYQFSVSTEPTISLDDDIKVFPNPVDEMLTLEMTNDWSGELNFQLVDISGKVLKAWTNAKHGEIYQEQVSVSDLANGMYQILVIGQTETKVVRFIKL